MIVSALLALTAAAATPDYRARLPQDEVIYFVLPDRFENDWKGRVCIVRPPSSASHLHALGLRAPH